MLLAYTDGLVEGRNTAGGAVRPQRVQERATAGAQLPLAALIAVLQAAATVHAGRRGSNGCTVVACRRVPAADQA